METENDFYQRSVREYADYVEGLETQLKEAKGTAEEAEIKKKLRRARINLTRSRNGIAQREATAALLDRLERQRVGA